MSKTDSLGEYVFDGIGIQDSVSFVMKAEKKGTLAGVTIVPDADVFPTP